MTTEFLLDRMGSEMDRTWYGYHGGQSLENFIFGEKERLREKPSRGLLGNLFCEGQYCCCLFHGKNRNRAVLLKDEPDPAGKSWRSQGQAVMKSVTHTTIQTSAPVGNWTFGQAYSQTRR